MLQAIYSKQGDVFLLSDGKQILQEKEGGSLHLSRNYKCLQQLILERHAKRVRKLPNRRRSVECKDKNFQ